VECASNYATFDKEVCDLWDTPCISVVDPTYSLMFVGLASFLLGIFAQMLFDRWWHLRTQIHTIMEEIKSITQMSMAFIRGKDLRSVAMRNDVSRWSILSLYLLEKQIDGVDLSRRTYGHTHTHTHTHIHTQRHTYLRTRSQVSATFAPLSPNSGSRN
jgi:hypothetical protein